MQWALGGQVLLTQPPEFCLCATHTHDLLVTKQAQVAESNVDPTRQDLWSSMGNPQVMRQTWSTLLINTKKRRPKQTAKIYKNLLQKPGGWDMQERVFKWGGEDVKNN